MGERIRLWRASSARGTRGSTSIIVQAFVLTLLSMICGSALSHPENKAYLDLQAGLNGELEAELGVPNALTSTVSSPTFKTPRGPCTAEVVTRRVLGPPTQQNQTRWRIRCPTTQNLTVTFVGLGAPVLVSLAWRDKTQTSLLDSGSNQVSLKTPGLGVRPPTSANPPAKSPPTTAPGETAADKKIRRQTRWSIAGGILAFLIFAIAIVRGR